MTEDQLQRSVVEWLEIAKPACVWFHIPNQPRSKVQGAKQKRMGAKAGVSDLVFIWGHGCACIELKRPKTSTQRAGVMNSDQKAFRLECLGRAIPYALAYSLEDVQEALKLWRLV